MGHICYGASKCRRILFDVEYIVTLNSRLGVTEGNQKMAPFVRSHMGSYSTSIVSMAVSCVVFELKRNIGRKTPIFHIPSITFNLYLYPPDTYTCMYIPLICVCTCSNVNFDIDLHQTISVIFAFITLSLFHSRLKTYLFNKSFPP